MTVEMKASKRFRLPQKKGWKWLNEGDAYSVPSVTTAEHHEETGRGTRVQTPVKPAKKEA